MAVMGLRLAQRANGVSRLHGAVSRGDVPRAVAGLRHRRGADHVDHQRRARADLGGPARSSSWPRSTSGRSSPPRRRHWEQRRPRSPTRRSGRCAAQMRGRPGRRRPAPGALVVAQARRQPGRAGLGRLRARPRRADDRVRPPRADVQAAHPDAARPRAAAGACCCTPTRPVQIVIAGKSHPADDNGKRLIQQMVRFADDPEVRHRIAFLPNYDIGMAQHAVPGLRRLAEQPAAPARGVRHVRHEGRAQRRAEPVHPRRLVGRVVRRRERLGDPDRRRRRRPRPPRRPRGRRALRPHREPVAPRFYDRDARGLPRALARDGAAHAARRSGPRCSPTRMVADYVHKLYVPAAAPAGRSARPWTRARGSRRSRSGCAPSGAAVRVDHVESLGRRRRAAGGRRDPGAGVRVARAQLAPRDVDVQLVYGRVSPSDTLTDLVTAPLQHVEEIEPGRHRFEGSVRLRAHGPVRVHVRVLPHVEGARRPRRARRS